MPYIIMKRDDIPAATLQVLDLDPNTSLRNYTLDVPGQTKYIDPVQNDQVVLYDPGSGDVYTHRDYYGLAAWFLTNVTDGAGAAATGNFTIVTNPVEGDTVTINNTTILGPSVTLTFSATPSSIYEVQIGASIDGSANNLVGVINNPDVGLTPYVSASFGGGGVATIDAVQEGTAGNGIGLTTNTANIAPTAMAGGVDSAPLTAAQANTDAADVLGLLAFGDLTSAAGVLTLAAINGALTTGSITAAQLDDVLDILAGRVYFVPKNTQVGTGGVFFVFPAVGTANGPRFITNSLRILFNNDGLPLSFTMGELAGFVDMGFVYQGVPGNPDGEAVVVYNDDGTFYTP